MIGGAAGLQQSATPTWRHVLAWQGPAMGGTLAIDVTLPGTGGRSAVAHARHSATAAARRIDAWAARLTRFEPGSDLSRLNASGAFEVSVRPTVAAVLEWAAEASAATAGVVDAGLLRERLAAETGAFPPEPARAITGPGSSWTMSRSGRGARVRRTPAVQFDLDGVAKGWLADRALRLFHAFAGAIVDADGDIAIRLAREDSIDVGVASPWGEEIAHRIHLDGRHGRSVVGIATSGITVHRWTSSGDPSGAGGHHLIDPRTRRPAVTDVVQATVVAGSAREAEALAKTAVILGPTAGLEALDRGGALAAILVTADHGCIVTTPGGDGVSAD